MKICNICKQEKNESEFSIRHNTKSQVGPYCRECKRKYDREYYKKTQVSRTARKRKTQTATRIRNREIILAYLREHPCVDCGETDVVVLEFDHRLRGNKEYCISTVIHYSEETLLREIAKCDVRCANCHRRKTSKENSSFRMLSNNVK